MTRYIVFEPPEQGETGAAGDGSSAGDRTVFLRDSFSGWALLFPFLWLFRHGLWAWGLLVLALTVGLSLAQGAAAFAAGILSLAVAVLVALEGPSLRAARHRRGGWTEAAVVEAKDESEAELIYYAGKENQDLDGAEADFAAARPLMQVLPAHARPPRRGGTGGFFDPARMR